MAVRVFDPVLRFNSARVSVRGYGIGLELPSSLIVVVNDDCSTIKRQS